MKIFYVETGPDCALIETSTLNAAQKEALLEAGTCVGVQCVRLATDEDIQWVYKMGGYVPDTPRTRKLIGDKL